MARTPESIVKKEVRALLDSVGAWRFAPSMNGYGRHGIPDDISCYRGYFLAVEEKAEHGKLTVWQAKEIDAINAAGGIAIVAQAPHHIEQVKAALAVIDDILA